MKRIRVFITGEVQGVGFRGFIRRKAKELGLKGWVRNLPDGRVEAVFEGETTSIQEMLVACERGPPISDVRGVNVKEEELEGEEDFEIKF